jgi:sigma-E factor negative regulatory protein RseC
MIEQTAVVLRLEGRFAVVEVQRQSSCGQCNAKQGCGTGLLEDSIGRRSMQIRAENRCDARPADEVVVAIPETGFIKTAFFTYLMPLLLMLLGAVLARQLGAGDLLSVFGAAIGFGLSLLVLRVYSRKLERERLHQPVIIRKARPPVTVEFHDIHKEQQPF